MCELTVIVATKNEKEYIANTLSHLQISIKEAKKQGIQTELIIVDSSTEDTATIASQFTPKVHRLPIQGISKARNYGAAQASGQILIFMDADTLLQKNTLIDVFSMFKNKKAVSTISFVMPTVQSKLPVSTKLFYVLDCAFIRACAFLPFLIGFYNRGDIIAIKRDTFEEIKGFNEALCMMEITELLINASKLGKIKVLSSPVFESSRRLKQWGVLKSYRVWWQNYVYFYVFKRLHDSSYESVR
ncbi:MAG: glycosyltransferase [Nitrososphaerota archaeon]|jgi:glycosyltransferase involved in cell wall biosynthesis|nr:glycosyltransferase [Nitrososphaerota archaeon]